MSALSHFCLHFARVLHPSDEPAAHELAGILAEMDDHGLGEALAEIANTSWIEPPHGALRWDPKNLWGFPTDGTGHLVPEWWKARISGMAASTAPGKKVSEIRKSSHTRDAHAHV